LTTDIIRRHIQLARTTPLPPAPAATPPPPHLALIFIHTVTPFLSLGLQSRY